VRRDNRGQLSRDVGDDPRRGLAGKRGPQQDGNSSSLSLVARNRPRTGTRIARAGGIEPVLEGTLVADRRTRPDRLTSGTTVSPPAPEAIAPASIDLTTPRSATSTDAPTVPLHQKTLCHDHRGPANPPFANPEHLFMGVHKKAREHRPDVSRPVHLQSIAQWCVGRGPETRFVAGDIRDDIPLRSPRPPVCNQLHRHSDFADPKLDSSRDTRIMP
jgi:hypothetical protein